MDDKMLMRVVNSTMKGRLLYLFGDKRAKENLQITFDKLARYRNVGCDQQQERSNNKETQFGSKPPVKVERISQTSKTFNIEH